MPIQLALGLTTVIMAVSHIVPLREFYEGVDWPVVVLLGAMIPLGGALESTGTTELLVAGLLVLVGELSRSDSGCDSCSHHDNIRCTE